MSKDDGPRPGTTAEALANLKPVFRPDGEITAGNACPLNDGAAAVVPEFYAPLQPPRYDLLDDR